MVTSPRVKAPPLSCDCHFHIFGPYDRFPLDEGRRYTPPEALVSDYLTMAETVGLQRMVVVQASPYGTDNRVTLDAVESFGRQRAVAVIVIGETISAATSAWPARGRCARRALQPGVRQRHAGRAASGDGAPAGPAGLAYPGLC